MGADREDGRQNKETERQTYGQRDRDRQRVRETGVYTESDKYRLIDR